MADIDKSTAQREFATKALVAVGIATLIVALVLVVVFVARPLLVIFAGVLLAVLLRALTDVLHRATGLPCGIALWVVIVGLAAAVFGLGWFIATQAAAEFAQLGTGLGEAWKRVRDYIEGFGWGRVALEHLTKEGLPAGGPDVASRVMGGIVGALSALVVSVFIGLYLAVDPGLYRRGLLRLFPVHRRDRVDEIFHAMAVALRGWLLGTLFNMVVVCAATTLGLWLIGIPMAFALGTIAFFLEFIPYLGPVAAAVPALLIASGVGTTELIYTALLYWVIQSGEGYLLSPLVYQRSVDLPPAVTVSAQILLATLFGVLGVVFATPLTACALVLVQEAYIRDALGDPMRRAGDR